jgi:hypothetical protein
MSPGRRISNLDHPPRLRLRYYGECLSDRLGRNLKLTVNPRYEIGRMHDHEYSSVWSGANDTIEFARFAVAAPTKVRPLLPL